jgi:UDP-N-acetyl-D-mannosaminuronate dehydrogenase
MGKGNKMTHDYKKIIELLNNGNIVISDCTGLGYEASIRNALELAIALQPKPISEAQVDVEYLIYCPERCITNHERFEYDTVYTSTGCRHAWATHFYDISALPKPKVTG